MRHRRPAQALLAAFLASVLVSCGGREPLPNIVLITLDTTRADHLGCYGYFRGTSPHLDALAEESIFFRRCLAPMATTLPSHVSMFTGTYPYEHGVLANLRHGGTAFAPSPRLRTFAAICRDLGYRTAAFVSAAPLKEGSGIEAGFEVFDQPDGPQRNASDTNAQVFDWLDALEPGPFLLWVHYFDPHWPFNAPGEIRERYRSDHELLEYLQQRRVPESVIRSGPNKPENARWATNGYDAEVTFMDAALGRLLDHLDARADAGRTALLVVGDHGEGLCQHGEAAHGRTWHEQLWVPMFIRVPGEPPRSVEPTISVVDALPTLLGLIELPGERTFSDQATGRDVLAADFEVHPVLSQESGRYLDSPTYRYSLTTDRWKYILTRHAEGIEEELFDFEADPFELENLAAKIRSDHPATIDALRNELLDQLDTQRARGQELTAGTREAKPIDPELIEQLRSLGYTQ